MFSSKTPLTLALAAVAAGVSSVHAADGPQALPALTVSAGALNQTPEQMTQPAAVLQGESWFTQRETGLADSLESLPGVRASGFGPGSSRPVIRGLDGARVRVLSDGADVLDASTVSPDHAISADTALIERVEVLKGPATLLYGGGAIGGVVNLIDRRVPTYVPERGFEGEIDLRANTVADERAGSAGLTLGAGAFAMRLEGGKSEADPYRIPGNPSRQEGAYNDTDTGSVGFSWIGEQGYLGLAYSRQDREYGLLAHEHADCHTHGPDWHCGGHDDHDHDDDHDDHDHADAWIDMEQRRWDLRGEYLNPFASVERLRLRVADTDYRHLEMEGDEVGTRFTNRGTDGRLEITHAPIAGWRGVVGTQLTRRDFAAEGEEAYVPATLTHNRALFLLESYEAGAWLYEVGLRQEWQSIEVKQGSEEADHRGTSLSFGATWQFRPDLALYGTLSRSQRLPTAEELYATGPHAATRTVELGDPDLDRETAINAELGLRRAQGPVTFDVSVYRNEVDDFIYAADTGADPGAGYRVVEYRQADAVLQGIEGSVRWQATSSTGLTLFGDSVRGRLKDGGDLPRIPADRLGARIDQRLTAGFSAQLEATQVMRQDHTADYETETGDYTLLGAGLNWRGQLGESDVLLYLRGNNLLNEKARQHSSFIKDEVLLPGRNLTVGARLVF
ncbi:MAG: TonB-dependent receptor [Pseudomonadota bacterium]|nr:TonB-dependent receptor [Pseudomonadota bacterium]|tara:strand:+ start:271 stop:2298 length:2028 start_codon:yes stop_codon:yes gene_type:complete